MKFRPPSPFALDTEEPLSPSSGTSSSPLPPGRQRDRADCGCSSFPRGTDAGLASSRELAILAHVGTVSGSL